MDTLFQYAFACLAVLTPVVLVTLLLWQAGRCEANCDEPSDSSFD